MFHSPLEQPGGSPSNPVAPATTYTVTYNANGASGSPPTDSNSYKQGVTAIVLGAGSLTNGTNSFAGWTTSTTGAGASYATAATFAMGTANVTLYAVWIPATLTFTSSGTSITITGPATFSGALTIPAGVTSIGRSAFLNDVSMTIITIPSSVTSLADGALTGCTGLTSITIPSSVNSLGGDLFAGCTHLTSATIPASVGTIPAHAFENDADLGSFTIASGITTIGAQAFEGTTLSSITIPSSVTNWNNGGAFSGCAALTAVTIPSSVTSIGAQAFEGCSTLANVYEQASIPPALDYPYPTASNAFSGCAAGLQIHVPSGTVATYQTTENESTPGTSWNQYTAIIVTP